MRKDRQKKERFVARQRRRAREAGDLGRTLVAEPRAFPGKCGAIIKRSLRTLWSARGGGFYACGFVVCFLWLEFRTLVNEVSAASGVGSFLSEQLIEFLFRFSLQSLGNTIESFLWPLLVLDRYELVGAVGMLIGYLLFSQLLKDRLTAWLFDGKPPGTAPEAAIGDDDQPPPRDVPR